MGHILCGTRPHLAGEELTVKMNETAGGKGLGSRLPRLPPHAMPIPINGTLTSA